MSSDNKPTPVGGRVLRRHPIRIFAAAATLLIIAVLLLVLSVVQSRRPASALRQNGYLGPADAGKHYAAAGNGLAVAGADRICLYSAAGKLVAEAEVSFTQPVCVGSSLMGAYYDLYAPGIEALYPDGRHRTAATEGAVAFADVNETGLLTVILEKSDGTSVLMVYDTDLTALFRWEPGSGYIINARTHGEDSLCVNCVGGEGAVLHFFRIDSADEQARLELPGELVYDFDFLTDGTLAAVTGSRLVLVGSDGSVRSSLDYSGSHIEAWSLGGGFAAAATVSGESGGNGVITTVAPDGRILGSCSAPRHIIALSGGSDRLLILFSGNESTLYGDDLEEFVSYQPEDDVDQVFLTPNGMAFYAGSGGVTLVDFGR
ncbi:MAG: WD40 repeat domain-containing protein [Oscillospiraceae bacterium]|nr:WD40 repeat domain-containing protein [Oscillospiraceae bacterium]